MNVEENRFVERVRCLLAIARDPGASDSEQRVAFERAQRLMDRHAIEEWMLERGEQRPAPPIGGREIVFPSSPVNRWRKDLAAIVARGNRCKSSFKMGLAANHRWIVVGVTLYGIEADIDRSLTVWRAMEDSRSVSWRVRARATRGAKANAAWRNGYYQGFNDEIDIRYEQLRGAMDRDATGRELVVARESQIDEWMHDNVKLNDDPPALPRMGRVSRAAYRQGREAATSQDLGLDEVTR
ncbi:DUF2786 domain-containing protein [Bifidobacterium crudilactis]|nr:DUF2786 domain-containing protein [Bifidobacterium crudilactis]MDN6467721.1 DUF2786 domain-containing protein [Bifidobacterium crudilactis]MDN6558728.1 DUF2786 domain-containing protein [Bifidobacterium crudilactis]MDN6622256.1 DUF2786 domain-containing protein [Bifidobacterium crudilactis]MDN6772643.1 DUF2786 domain-containing protein [Bifidobacterium crudilactis]MDN6804711.1 DUF2786 domain-containing protein [Bifidobacterium crudilactis]